MFNSALSGDLRKATIEAKLGKHITAKLSSGKVELQVELGMATVSFDGEGNVVGSYGVVRGAVEFNDFGAELKALGVDLAGLQLTLSNFSSETLSWNIHYSSTIFGYDVGQHFPTFSDTININPVHYVVNNSGLLGNAARSLQNRNQQIQDALKKAKGY